MHFCNVLRPGSKVINVDYYLYSKFFFKNSGCQTIYREVTVTIWFLVFQPVMNYQS